MNRRQHAQEQQQRCAAAAVLQRAEHDRRDGSGPQRPGEPRFGLDSDRQPALNVWNDLSWPDVQPGAPGTFIDIAASPAAFPLAAPGPADQEKAVQFGDDQKVVWSHDMSAERPPRVLTSR